MQSNTLNALNRLNPALQQGLIFGFILGIVEIAFNYITDFLGLGPIGIVIALALYIVFAWMAGQRASQRTGRTATGVWAGLLTGFIGALLYSIVFGIIEFTHLNAVVQTYKTAAEQAHQDPNLVTPQTVTGSIIIGIVITLGLAILLGLVGGALGGSRGRRRALPPPTDQYQESMSEPPSRNSPVEPPSRTPPVDS